VSIDSEEDVTGMESDGVCEPQECKLEVSHILRWFLWWWLLMCGFAQMELLRLVDLQFCLCVWSFAYVTMLRVDIVFFFFRLMVLCILDNGFCSPT
jgi:hypothetical protein